MDSDDGGAKVAGQGVERVSEEVVTNVANESGPLAQPGVVVVPPDRIVTRTQHPMWVIRSDVHIPERIRTPDWFFARFNRADGDVPFITVPGSVDGQGSDQLVPSLDGKL